MIEQFYKKLAVPDSCYLGKRMSKRLFYENAQLNAADKRAFSEDIDRIKWMYTLKPETINIPRHVDEEREYYEIAVIQVELKQSKRFKRIAEVIHRAIPYPTLIIFADSSLVALSVADKRINLADREKIVVEEFLDTPWLDLGSLNDYETEFFRHLVFNSFSYNSLLEFYNDLMERIIALNCAVHSGVYALSMSDSEIDRSALLKEIRSLQKAQICLRSSLKAENQFSKQVELNIQLKKIESEILKLKTII